MTGPGKNITADADEFARAATEVIGADLELMRETRRVEAILRSREAPAATGGEPDWVEVPPVSGHQPVAVWLSNLFRRGGPIRR